MAHTWADNRPIYYGTATERAAFPAGGEAAGALFFDYDDETWYYWDGAAWQTVPAGIDPTGHTHSKLVASDGAPDPAFSADATGKVTAAVSLALAAGATIDEFSTDGTLAANSDVAIPTEKAVKAYVDISVQANLFVNGGPDIWQRTTNDTAVSTTRKYVADRWAVTTGAGTLANVQRSATVRSGHRSYYSMELIGAAGVTTADIDQRIEAIHAGYYKRQVTFSAYIYNGSGAAFTPRLFASTPSAVDNWAVSTVRNGGGAGEDLQSCTDAAWTQVTWTADVSGYTNIDNGLEIRLQVPSGSLVAGDTVRFAEATLVPGSGAIPFSMPDFQTELARCQRYCYHANTLAQNTAIFGFGTAYSTTACLIQTWFPVPMRTAPALATAGTLAITDSVTASACSVALATANQQSELWASLNCTGASGLTQFRLYFLIPNTDTAGRLLFTAEL